MMIPNRIFDKETTKVSKGKIQSLNWHTTILARAALCFKNTLLLMIIIALINANSAQGQVLWTEQLSLKTGQITAFNQDFIPPQIQHKLLVTYTQPLPPGFFQSGVSFSGFENYISNKTQFTISYQDPSETSILIKFKIGQDSFMRYFKINYIVKKTDANGANGRYLIFKQIFNESKLNDWNHISKQILSITFQSQNPYPNFQMDNICMSTISGLRMISSINKSNYLNLLNRVLQDQSSSIKTLEFTVQINDKSSLQQIQITTYIQNYLSNKWDNIPIRQHFTSTFTEDQNDQELKHLDLIVKNGLLDLENTIYFGIRGFSLGMGQVRLFALLQDTHRDDNSTSIQINKFTESVTVDFYVRATKNCNSTIYWHNHYECRDNCSDSGLVQKTFSTNNQNQNICLDCDATCDQCTQQTYLCNACVVGQNRKQVAVNTICECDKDQGYVEAGVLICQLCKEYLQGCQKCSDVYTCNTCMQGFQTNEINNDTNNVTCICPENQYTVSGICLSFPGCIQARSIITGKYCDECDQSSNFKQDLMNDYSCICKDGFQYNSELRVCQDECGNQKTAEGKCDDGNTFSGDGCSWNCDIELGFLCTEKEIGGPSKCLQKGDISIIFRYAQKVLDQNQAILAFQMQPSYPFLKENTFEDSMDTNIYYESKSVRYDPSNSFIYLTLAYKETLQKKDYEVNITFEGLGIQSQNISLPITLVGSNAALTYSEGPSKNSIIELSAMILAAICFLLALIASILNEKLIGMQLILPVQATFFSMSTLPLINIPSAIAALWPLTFSTGYNIISAFNISSNYMINSNSIRMHFTAQFVMNYNISFCLIFLMIIVFSILFGRLLCLQKQSRRLERLKNTLQDQEKKKKQQKKSQGKIQNKIYRHIINEQQSLQGNTKQEDPLLKAQNELQEVRESIYNWTGVLKVLFDRFFCILVLLDFMPVCFGYMLQMSQLSQFTEPISNFLNTSFLIIAVTTIVVCLYTIIYDYKSKKLIVFKCRKGKYAITYICIFLAYSILANPVAQIEFAAEILLGFSILPFALIFYQLPHWPQLINLQTILALICQLPWTLFAIVSMLVGFSHKDGQIDEQMATNQSFAVLGIIGISIIATIVRLVKTVDLSKLQFFEFTNGQVDFVNVKKKNNVNFMAPDRNQEWDQDSDLSVRQVMIIKKKQPKTNQNILSEQKKKDLLKAINDELKNEQNQDNGQDNGLEKIEKIKQRLRKQLKYKKKSGRIPTIQ